MSKYIESAPGALPVGMRPSHRLALLRTEREEKVYNSAPWRSYWQQKTRRAENERSGQSVPQEVSSSCVVSSGLHAINHDERVDSHACGRWCWQRGRHFCVRALTHRKKCKHTLTYTALPRIHVAVLRVVGPHTHTNTSMNVMSGVI